MVVGDSLGSVVAFDVLRRCAGSYPIQSLITMGSPLRKLARLRRRSAEVGAITPQTLPLRLNLYDRTDPVGESLHSTFPDYPIRDIEFDNGVGPLASHLYWDNPRVLELIAARLQELVFGG